MPGLVLTTEDYEHEVEQAGEVGRELAGEMAQKVIAVVDGFPGTEPQRDSIKLLTAMRIITIIDGTDG